MQIIINGLKQDVASPITLSGLLAGLNISRTRIAVELNMNIIDRQQFDQVFLKEGDRLEIINFVGGGSLR